MTSAFPARHRLHSRGVHLHSRHRFLCLLLFGPFLATSGLYPSHQIVGRQTATYLASAQALWFCSKTPDHLLFATKALGRHTIMATALPVCLSRMPRHSRQQAALSRVFVAPSLQRRFGSVPLEHSSYCDGRRLLGFLPQIRVSMPTTDGGETAEATRRTRRLFEYCSSNTLRRSTVTLVASSEEPLYSSRASRCRYQNPRCFSLPSCSGLRPAYPSKDSNLLKYCNRWTYGCWRSVSQALREPTTTPHSQASFGISKSTVERPSHIPNGVWQRLERGLHKNDKHPIGIVKRTIEDYFTGAESRSRSIAPADGEESEGDSGDPTGSSHRSQGWVSAERDEGRFDWGRKGYASWMSAATEQQQHASHCRHSGFYTEPDAPPHAVRTSSFFFRPSSSSSRSSGSHSCSDPSASPHLTAQEIPAPKWHALDSFFPIVSTQQNFDELLIPPDHVSRLPSETFYIDTDRQAHVVRTQCTAHQTELMQKGYEAVVWSSEVARRDRVDALHYPVFHQMDGIRIMRHDELRRLTLLFERYGEEAFASQSSVSCSPDNLYRSDVVVRHLQRSVEGLVDFLFGTATRRRWDYDASFPFTNPSMELEIFFDGKWIEILGCGVIKDAILQRCGLPHNSTGWAFGIGLERMAMLLFDVRDIRYFWSEDDRFHKQFSTGSLSCRFVPYSRNPPVYKDLSFWVSPDFRETLFFELCREAVGNRLESVDLIDEYTKGEKRSLCYRLTYRALDQNLTHDEVNELQRKLIVCCETELGINVR